MSGFLSFLRGFVMLPTSPPPGLRRPTRPPVPEGAARPRPSRPVNLLKARHLPRCEHCQTCNPVRPCDVCEAVADLIGQMRVLRAMILEERERGGRLRAALADRCGVVA